LYKSNVFRSLALPKGYVWQYRYRREHIHGNLITNLQSLKGQSGVYFFATGNDLKIDPDKRTLTYHPIRNVVVCDVVEDQLTGRVHFFLEMGDFVDVLPLPATPADRLSAKCLVTKITTQAAPAKNWEERVKGLAAHFPDLLFFHIAAVRKDRVTLQPEYSASDRASRYPLTEETGYQVDISFFDPKGGRKGLLVDNSSPDAALNVPSTHYVGAETDTTTFPLETHTLPREHLLARTVFKERPRSAPAATAPSPPAGAQATPPATADEEQPVFDVQLQWYVTRGSHKPWVFGGLALMAAVGVALAKLATDDLSKTCLTWVNAVLALGAAICVAVPAALLYWLFHKK
jgi:hypothetical protein